MRIQLPLVGQSQYAPSILEKYRNSACGPTTVFVILRYLSLQEEHKSINELYQLLGCTPIGLFSHDLTRNLRKLLSPSYDVRKCSVDDALNEINEGRPVILKFDRYFSLHFFTKGDFDYHYVPMIGFEKKKDDLILIIHDNGSPYQDSQIREISYHKNRAILRFFKLIPLKHEGASMTGNE